MAPSCSIGVLHELEPQSLLGFSQRKPCAGEAVGMGFDTDLQVPGNLFKTVSSQENSFIPGGSIVGTKEIKSISFQVTVQAESPQRKC